MKTKLSYEVQQMAATTDKPHEIKWRTVAKFLTEKDASDFVHKVLILRSPCPTKILMPVEAAVVAASRHGGAN